MGLKDAIRNKIIMAGAENLDKQIDGTKVGKDLMALAVAKVGQKAAKNVAEGPLSNLLHEIKVGLWADKKALAADYLRLARILDPTIQAK